MVVSSLSLLSFRLLAFRSVFLWRPYVSPSAGHMRRLIVPENSNLVLGTWPAARVHLCFVFLSYIFSFVSYFFSHFLFFSFPFSFSSLSSAHIIP